MRTEGSCQTSHKILEFVSISIILGFTITDCISAAMLATIVIFKQAEFSQYALKYPKNLYKEA